MSKIDRKTCLDNAISCVCGQREEDYGTPENNFSRIAKLWAAYKGVEFNARDVAAMMALLKIARIASGKTNDDNWVDLAGYAACGCELEAVSDKITIAEHLARCKVCENQKAVGGCAFHIHVVCLDGDKDKKIYQCTKFKRRVEEGEKK